MLQCEHRSTPCNRTYQWRGRIVWLVSAACGRLYGHRYRCCHKFRPRPAMGVISSTSASPKDCSRSSFFDSHRCVLYGSRMHGTKDIFTCPNGNHANVSLCLRLPLLGSHSLMLAMAAFPSPGGSLGSTSTPERPSTLSGSTQVSESL